METAALLIRVSTAITMVVYGVSQIIKPTHWLSYVPPWLSRLLPGNDLLMMQLHGGGNLILGLWLMLGVSPALAAWLCLAWWISIWPFAFYYDWRDGLRDFVIICGLAAYLWLI